MHSHGNANVGSVSLEQLTALNDEMAALIRAGIPLEQGLGALASELPGRSGKVAEILALRMASGESLPEILAAEDSLFPPIWRAVVAAGLRSGHLSAALESLSVTARRTAEVRRLVGAGVLYPLLVVALAFALLVFLILEIVPVLLQARQDLVGDADPMMAGFQWLGSHVLWWAVPIPILGAILCVGWWRSTGRVVWHESKIAKPWQWLGGVGGIRQTLRNGRMATFAEMMALLIKGRVPLHEAIVLAADVAGDRAFQRAGRQMAGLLQQGDGITRREELPAHFPPLLGWLMMAYGQRSDLGESLARSAAVYRRRAEYAATQTAILLPIACTVLVGGAATILCGLVVFVPFTRFLFSLSGV